MIEQKKQIITILNEGINIKAYINTTCNISGLVLMRTDSYSSTI